MTDVGPILQARISQTYMARFESARVPPVEVLTFKASSIGVRDHGEPSERLLAAAHALGGELWVPPPNFEVTESFGEEPVYPSGVEALIRDLVHYDLREARSADPALTNIAARYRPVDPDREAILSMNLRAGLEPADVHDVVTRIMYQPTVPIEQSPLEGVPLAALVSRAGAGGVAIGIAVITGFPWPIGIVVAGVSYILIRALVGVGGGLEEGLHERTKEWVLNWGKSGTPPQGAAPPTGTPAAGATGGGSGSPAAGSP